MGSCTSSPFFIVIRPCRCVAPVEDENLLDCHYKRSKNLDPSLTLRMAAIPTERRQKCFMGGGSKKDN